ncbi:type II toxin-antitoxin system RelE/ParE family toxin [Thiohalorhabdus sp.]|uniref:type II toxin-antitoxin system RelE/ParE family toxin n=1 Tax=Thiohalorhabdus sp. TaxID=3094134 RepID=UPI002FC344D6
MIRKFADKGLQRFFESSNKSGIPPELADKLRRQLDRLDIANSPEEMDLPGYAFHELKGQRNGTYAVKVTGNRRLTFRFEDGGAVDVKLEDYH